MAQYNNSNQPLNGNSENNQSQNQNPNIGMNQGSNQNPNFNNGYNQGQNRGLFGNMNQRQNQNPTQSQSQNINQSGNQGQNQTSSQHGRNQRNPFGFNRFGNSYSNYYNNPNNDLNQDNNRENSLNNNNINNEAKTITNEPRTILNETQTKSNEPRSNEPRTSEPRTSEPRTSEPRTNESRFYEARTNGNTRNRSSYYSSTEQEMSDKKINNDDPIFNNQNDNVNQTNEAIINENANKQNHQNHDNEHSNQNNIMPLNSSSSNNNENNQSYDENNNTKRMNHHTSELNAASMRNSFEMNDGGTPVIKLGGQYGFNLEKKMNTERGIGKQSNELSRPLEEDVVKINSMAVAERKHSMNKLYCSDKPYPKIEVTGENVDYALYLLNDYASSLSELTAITSYSFLNLVIEDEYQEIKDTYKSISIVEMHHLHMLGEIIKKLGVLPRYYAKETNQITMWTSNFVSGETDMKTTLLNSIKNEEAGIIQYQKHIELIDDENIKVVLARIILDEEVHVTLLKDLYKKYCPESYDEVFNGKIVSKLDI